MKKDNINPEHYKTNIAGLESADIIAAVLGAPDKQLTKFESAMVFNILKYAIRCGLKGDNKEQFKKIRRYCDFAINHLEGRRITEETSNS